jgi:TonB family protein
MAGERGSREGKRGIALIWMYQGDESAKGGDGISALEAFEKAAQYYEDTLIYRRLLIGYVSIQNYDKAEEVCLKDLKLYPSFEPSAMFLSNRYYNQGILKFTNGNYREAIDLLSKSFDLDPGQTKALLSIGYCYERLNDTEKAFANYSNAMFDSSVMPTATIAISRIFRSRGKINEAYQMLIKSINAAPMNVESWDEIGRLYHDLGKRDEFIECWKAKALLGDDDAHADLMKWDITDDVFRPAQLPWLKVNPFLSETEPPDFVPVDKMPVPITTMQPEYPEVARRAGVEGTVWVKLLVNKNGIPTKALIQKSDAEIFNSVSIFAAMQFRFSPAFINGEQVSVWASIPFRFKLNR